MSGDIGAVAKSAGNVLTEWGPAHGISVIVIIGLGWFLFQFMKMHSKASLALTDIKNSVEKVNESVKQSNGILEAIGGGLAEVVESNKEIRKNTKETSDKVNTQSSEIRDISKEVASLKGFLEGKDI